MVPEEKGEEEEDDAFFDLRSLARRVVDFFAVAAAAAAGFLASRLLSQVVDMMGRPENKARYRTSDGEAGKSPC